MLPTPGQQALDLLQMGHPPRTPGHGQDLKVGQSFLALFPDEFSDCSFVHSTFVLPDVFGNPYLYIRHNSPSLLGPGPAAVRPCEWSLSIGVSPTPTFGRYAQAMPTHRCSQSHSGLSVHL